MTHDELYAARVIQLEEEGLTTSDAQSVADVEDSFGKLADCYEEELRLRAAGVKVIVID